MITENPRIPSVSVVSEVGMFGMTTSELMRDLARETLELDNSQDEGTASPVSEAQRGSQQTDVLRGGKSSVLTNGSLRLLVTAAETPANVPVGSPRHGDELTKELRQKNRNLDLTQYLLQQKPVLDFSKYLINWSELQEESIDNQVDSKDTALTEEIGNINVKNTTKLQRFRRSLTNFKIRVSRPLTLLTACFSSKTAL